MSSEKKYIEIQNEDISFPPNQGAIDKSPSNSHSQKAFFREFFHDSLAPLPSVACGSLAFFLKETGGEVGELPYQETIKVPKGMGSPVFPWDKVN